MHKRLSNLKTIKVLYLLKIMFLHEDLLDSEYILQKMKNLEKMIKTLKILLFVMEKVKKLDILKEKKLQKILIGLIGIRFLLQELII